MGKSGSNDLTLTDILKQIDNKDFFFRHGLSSEKKKGYHQCPFCNKVEKFSLNVDKGLWRCFACGESGNQVTFLSKLKGVTKGEAVQEIKKELGIEDNYTRRNRNTLTRRTPEVKEPTDQEPKVHPYHRLVELSTLSDEHRQQLKEKRGFSNQTIDELMFRTGGEHIAEVVDRLRQEYDDDKLTQVGILRDINGSLLIEEQLLDDRILIPYLDTNRQAYHIRPHKLGLKGIPSQIYSRSFLQAAKSANLKKVILTEGEFKACALNQWGIPGIAIPGISSFGRNSFERLVQELREFGIAEVCVIFDSEEKGNPAYSNFKEQVSDRYDTQLWSYLMAYKLQKEGFRTTIGWLPPEWRIEGKIDFDMALALGKTKRDVEKVIAQALLPKEFLDSLDEDGQRVVRRKVAKHFAKIKIRREFNRYLVPQEVGKGDNKETLWIPISNFVINIKSNFYMGDAVVRNIELVNEYGETSDTFPLDAGPMAGLQQFKQFILSKGNYIFEGSATDLNKVWQFEFLNDNGELIYMPEQIGWIERHRLWLFGNLAIKDGTVYRPDSDGIIWIDGKGFKPQSLSINASGAQTEDAIPALYTRDIDIKDIALKMKESVGGYEAYMGIGWVVATVFSRDIFAKYKCMPILFPHGRRESGKSTFMRWMNRFFGIETEGVSVGKTTTANFVARALSYYSCLGTWFDEYRNEPGVVEKDGLFRSAYNRQLSGKGTATAFQAKGFSVHSAIAISGEELPKDNGLFTRLVPLQISSYKRNREYFDLINRQSEYFSGFVYHLITNYDLYRDKILNGIVELKRDLVEVGITDRTAENWAICAAAFEATVFPDDNYILWVEKSCQEMKQTGEQEHMLNIFWQDLSSMVNRGDLGDTHFTWDEENLYFWMPGVYSEWCIYYRKKTGREPFDRLSIIQYLQDEPYYRGYHQKKVKGRNLKLYSVDRKGTDTINEIFEGLRPVSALGNY